MLGASLKTIWSFFCCGLRVSFTKTAFTSRRLLSFKNLVPPLSSAGLLSTTRFFYCQELESIQATRRNPVSEGDRSLLHAHACFFGERQQTSNKQKIRKCKRTTNKIVNAGPTLRVIALRAGALSQMQGAQVPALRPCEGCGRQRKKRTAA